MWGGGGEGGVKITPCLKPVRIMLENSNLVRSAHTYVVSEDLPFITKIIVFWQK